MNQSNKFNAISHLARISNKLANFQLTNKKEIISIKLAGISHSVLLSTTKSFSYLFVHNMFYNDSILSRRGPLANIWLAAHWDRRLTKTQVITTNIESSVRDIVTGTLPPMALRLTGQLLLGVTKIYGRQTTYLFEDCKEALDRLRSTFKKNRDSNLPAGASRASHAAITLPMPANLDDALAPEPEFDLEYDQAFKSCHLSIIIYLYRAFLKAEGGDLAPATINQLPIKSKIFETSYIDYGLPVERESEIPASELPDLELGRRLTMNSVDTAFNPLRQSIEVGRRAETPRQSLPFSPLRTPSKHVDFEQIILENDYGIFDEPLMTKIVEQQHRESDAPILGLETALSVNTVTKQKTIRRKQGVARKKKAIQLDDETELTNASIQELVRDSSLIMLPKPSWTEICLAKSLYMLNIAPSERISRTQTTHQDQEAENFIEQVPLQDDYYLLGPADYAIDAPVMETNIKCAAYHGDEQAAPSPRRRRVEDEQDENAAPQDNRRSIYSPRRPSEILKMMADDPSSMLALWQRKLDLGKAIDLEEIIPMPIKRMQAADTFLMALVLHSRGLIKTEQLTPYGTITVIAKEQLFSSTADNDTIVV